MKTEPIKPTEPTLTIKEGEIEDAINYINYMLSSKQFHFQHFRRDNHRAIILSPYGAYVNVMDEVVERFKNVGWDCFWDLANDARGPHYCFYVHEKHFTK